MHIFWRSAFLPLLVKCRIFLFRTAFDHQAKWGAADDLGLTEFFQIGFYLPVCQAGKIFSLNAANKKGTGNEVIILQHPIKGQTQYFSLVVTNHRHRIGPGINGLNDSAHQLLHGLQAAGNFRRTGFLARFH